MFEFDKMAQTKKEGEVISGKEAFTLFETYGFPIEMTAELAAEKNLSVDKKGYEIALTTHQEKSRTATRKKV